MSFEFPFEYARISGLGRLFYPVVKFELMTVTGWKEFDFLVDTGADVTTVPLDFLQVLGIDSHALKTTTTVGVGGMSVKTWDFSFRMRLGGAEFRVAASAVDTKNDFLPFLLVRKDIFEERYNLTLDSRRKVTIISENT